MKTNKITVLISIFNLFLLLFLFSGSSSGENGIFIGNNCLLTEDGSYLKIVYNGSTRFLLNKTSGNITAGSIDGTGENTLYTSVINANTVTGNLVTIPYLELISHPDLTMVKSRAYVYTKSGKLILAYTDNSYNTYYYWTELTLGEDITRWTYSSTEP